ncbi:iron-containing redox enzyme family protein [Amycolatopsis nigrescens]|uniref:iron-containing redox enzyme family protein n=1 Tax=Amycolatopsis nigrescens TaxID=381445 RepID=UPI000364B256|nr:iron-containing redox enzyme family protein [Amycolatopsis nigrescens]
MSAPDTADIQRALYRYNRSVPDAAGYAELLDLERRWVVRRVAEYEAAAPRFGTLTEVLAALGDRLTEEERSGPTEDEVFLAERATLDQFKVVVAEFAVDGLVESQSHLAIVPRLPAKVRTCVLRVLIDEFGCGNDAQEHAQLYTALVEELGMPTDPETYVDSVSAQCLAFVNQFHWLAGRAPSPEYFLGAYAYFEASVLYAFRCYAAACERLGIRNGRYYSEHLHIDSFHSKQMRGAIRALEQYRPVDLRKVWAGIELSSAIAAEATAAAIGRARQLVSVR